MLKDHDNVAVVSSLYETPDWVWHVPIQSGCFGLYGIIPSKLRPDYYEDTVKKVLVSVESLINFVDIHSCYIPRPCSRSRWDPAAITYLIRTCTSKFVPT